MVGLQRIRGIPSELGDGVLQRRWEARRILEHRRVHDHGRQFAEALRERSHIFSVGACFLE